MNELHNKTCYLYVLDTLADWEIGYITAELNSRRFLVKGADVQLVKIGNTSKPIKTMGGVIIEPDMVVADVKLQDGDMLILPGADTWMDEKNMKILELVSAVVDTNISVAAICGATMALAQKGLLNSRRHTSNDMEYLKMVCPNYSGSSCYINAPAVVDDNLITATGLAPLEFSYEVFKKMSVMKSETLESWYQLYKTREPQYFHALMKSLE